MECDTILHGEALNVLSTLPDASVDAVITDPPFAFAGGISNGLSSRVDSQFFEHWLVAVFRELHRVSRPEAAWFLWCDWRTASVYDIALQKAAIDYHDTRHVTQVIVHDREMVGMGTPFRNQLDWIALVRGKKTDFSTRIPKNQPNIIREYWYYGKHAHHPAEKSVAIARRLVNWITSPGGIVLDPFAGSGTTCLAAKIKGRRYIGIEREAEYVEIATKRVAGAPPAPIPIKQPRSKKMVESGLQLDLWTA